MTPAPLTSLHLFRIGPADVPAALLRMAADRRRLRRTPGLTFAKLLGTGDGRTFTLRDSDLLQWGLLAVWNNAAALAAFERDSPVASGWRHMAREVQRFDLLPLRARGAWSGRSPFAPSGAGAADRAAGGAVAALTRARIRPSRWRLFWRSVPPVAMSARSAPGLEFAVGIGEAPLGLQGTFSVWRSAAALHTFAYRGDAHREAIDATQRHRWYAEDLFARFAVLQVTKLHR